MNKNVIAVLKDTSYNLQYKDDCNTDAALYLLVGGGITLGLWILSIIAVLTPCESDDL